MGLPELSFSYRAAARDVAARTKRGIVALILRDSGLDPGVYPVVYEADIPVELGGDNQAAVKRAMIGSINKPSQLLLSVIGGYAEDEAPESGDFAVIRGLKQLAGMEYDYISGPADMTEEETQALSDAIIALRKGNYVGKGVLPHMAADNEAITNFTTDGIVTANAIFDAAGYCGRIAGMLAGAPLEGSATGAELSEVTDFTAAEDEDAAIDGGELILHNDGRKIRIARAVNSKTTIGPTEHSILKKIKTLEAIDLIHYYAITTAEDNYRGRCANTYDNKMLLVGALGEYLDQLEKEGVLDKDSGGAEIDIEATRAYLKQQGVSVSSMSDEEINRHPTADVVMIQLYGYLLDAMEDFRIGFTITN